MPNISIIVPVYETEVYLSRCTESIWNQTLQNLELVLVDDGTTDRSSEMCDEYALIDSRTVVVHGKNKGVSSARNTGLDISGGEYVTFVDSDDYIESNYLSSISHNGYDLVCQGSIIESEEGEILTVRKIRDFNSVHISNNDIKDLFLDDSLGYMCGKLYRRSIISQNLIRFKCDLNFLEDTVFTVKFAKYAKKILCENTANYHYVRYHSHQSLSGTHDSQMIKRAKKALSEICYDISDGDNTNEKKYFTEKMNEFYRIYFNRNVRKWAIIHLLHNCHVILELSSDNDFVECCTLIGTDYLCPTVEKAVIKQESLGIIIACTKYSVYVLYQRIVNRVKKIL